MSQENLERAAQFYDAWNRGDLNWMGDRVTGDFELRPFVGFVDLEAVYRGKAGWELFCQTWLEVWEAAPVTVESLTDHEDRVLALLTFNATGRESGVSVPMKLSQVATFRDRQLCALDVLEGWDHAL